MSMRNDLVDDRSLMDEFVHAANNRLHSILINIDSALFENGKAPYSARVLQAIKEQSNSMALIIEAMQILSSIPTHNRTTVDINQTILRAVELAKFMYRKSSVKFITNLSATQPLVVADRALLEKCLLYLLDYLVNTSPPHSQIEIITEDQKNNTGINVMIAVKAAEKTCNQIKDIFDLSYNLKTNDNLQLKLGLALSQQIITYFKGNISFQNKKGHSTFLTISFPKYAVRNTFSDIKNHPENATIPKDIAHQL